MSNIVANSSNNSTRTCLEQILPDIKRLLISKDINFKITGVEIINHLLIEPQKIVAAKFFKPIQDTFIDEDIIEFLSDALTTLNLRLIERIYHCLELLSISNKFYKPHYLIIINESILRSLHYFIKKNENIILNKGLDLLIVILQGVVWRKISILSTCCHLDQLLSVLASVIDIPLKKRSETERVRVINTSLLLYGLLDQQQNQFNQNTRWNLKSSEIRYLVFVIENCLTKLALMCDQSLENSLQYISIICKLCALIYRLPKRIIIEENTVLLKDIHTKLRDLTFFMIENTCSSKILKLNITSFIFHLVEDWYNCISDLLKDEDENKVTQFAISLISKGFLIQSTKTLQLTRCYLGNELSCLTAIRHCVGNILATLLIAESTLKMTPKEQSELHQRVLKGVLAWPENPSEVLIPGESSDAYIVFLYLSILCHQRPIKWGCHLNVLSRLIQYTDLQVYPLVLLKCLWLDFTVAWLSQNEISNMNLPAHGILISALELAAAWPGLKAVFTRHPSLVFWACSPIAVPSKLRKEIISLWLEEKTSHGEALIENLVLASPEAEVCLIDIVTYGEEYLSKSAARVLTRVIETQQQNRQAHLIDTLWQLLPILLSGFASNNRDIKLENVVSLLEICSSGIPSQLESAIRAASWLAQLLIEPRPRNTDFYRAAVRYYFVLLLVSVNSDDNLILICLSSNIRLLSVIGTYVETTEDPELCSLAIRYLAYLLYFQKKLNVTCNDGININIGRLLELLEEGDEGVQESVLQMIYVLLESSNLNQDWTKTVIHFNRTNEEEFISHLRFLFMKLLHLCGKGFTEMVDHSWECLRSIMSFACRYSDSQLLYHFTTHPWISTLCRLTIPISDDNSKETKNSSFDKPISKGFLNFLTQWIHSYSLFLENNSTNDGKEDNNIVMIKRIIKKKLLSQSLPSADLKPFYLNIYDKILTVKFNLPETLIEDIQKHIHLLNTT